MTGRQKNARVTWQLAIVGVTLIASPASSQPSAPIAATVTAQPATTAPTASPSRDVTLSTDRARRMTLPVFITGKGPYPFMIDTGSQRTILSTELASSLTLPLGQAVRIISLSGESHLPTAAIAQLRYGEEEVRDLVTPLISETHLGGPGILGLDGLQGKKLVLDFLAQRMEVRDSDGKRDRSRDAEDDDIIVVQARSRMGQLLLVNCEVGGKRTNVILDTGAQYSVGNHALLQKLRADQLRVPPQPVELVSVTGEAVQAQIAVVKSVTVGQATLRDVPVIFTDAAPFKELKLSEKPAMFLGMQILRLFDRIAVDFEHKRVDFLMPDKPHTASGTAERTGEAG